MSQSPATPSDGFMATKNIPPDKYLYVVISGNDILLHDKNWIENELRKIVSLCQGRRFCIIAGLLQLLHDNYQQDIEKIKEFIKIAKNIPKR